MDADVARVDIQLRRGAMMSGQGDAAAAAGSAGAEEPLPPGAPPDADGSCRDGTAPGSAAATAASISGSGATGTEILARRLRGHSERAAHATVPLPSEASLAGASGAEADSARVQREERITAWRAAAAAASAAAAAEQEIVPERDHLAAEAAEATNVVAEAAGLRLHLSSTSSTGYKGVVERASGRFFQAQHRVDGRKLCLGSFKSAVEAAVAYARTVGPRQGPRFGVGDRVLCRRVETCPPSDEILDEEAGGVWDVGRVTQVWPSNWLGTREGRAAPPYQVQLVSGMYVYPEHDSDTCIRRGPRDGIRDVAGPGSCPPQLAVEPPASCDVEVLTAEETAALLSPDGQALLRDAAEAFGVPLEAGGEPYRWLSGCVVRRRAEDPPPGQPLYSPARIRAVLPPAGSGDPVARQWRLELTAFVDGEARDEPAAPLRLLSNAVGEEEECVGDLSAWGARGGRCEALPVVRALSCGEGAVRLDRLVATARSGIAAIDKWTELLHEAGVYEDESASGEHKFVVIGEWSQHRILFSRLHGARAALRDFFDEITHPEMEEGDAAVWQSWLVRPFAEWPSVRRGIGTAWVRWLFGPEQRRAGFRALLDFVDHEHGLPREEHTARDDAGRFSLAGAAYAALIGAVGELEADGLMEKLDDPDREGCAVCRRTVRSCSEWTQLFPCRHWCCTECVYKWRRAAEQRGQEEDEEEEAQVAHLGACPLCRGRVVRWSHMCLRRRAPFS